MKSKLIRGISIVFLSLIVMSGCATKKVISTSSVVQDKTVNIVTSFYPMYIATLNVAKDIPNVKVTNMTKPITGCLHDYPITPDDMIKLESAQVFVVNGAGMESFMDKVIKQIPNLKILESSKGIDLIKGEGDEGDNPHVWVSISNAITQVRNIEKELSVLDPDNAIKYKANTDEYVKKLETERDKMHKALDTLKNRDIVTLHEAFPYFAKEFNLNIIGVIEREPGSEPSAKDLDETILQVKKLKVKALFAEPQYPTKAADTIAKEIGSKVYSLDPAVTGPMEADAYINIMESNLKTLQEALE